MANLTPPLPLPIVPSNLVVNLVSPTEVLLWWLNLDGDDIEIERTGNLNFMPKITGMKNVSAVGYKDTNLSPGTDYYYRVRAINETGSSPYTEFIFIRTPEVLPRPRPSLPATVQSVDKPEFDLLPFKVEQRPGDHPAHDVLTAKPSLEIKLKMVLIGLGLVLLGMLIVTLKRD